MIIPGMVPVPAAHLAKESHCGINNIVLLLFSEKPRNSCQGVRANRDTRDSG